MLLIGCFLRQFQLSLVKHRTVEVGMRNPSIVYHWIPTHNVAANDPTQCLVVKSRICRIQNKSPSFFAVDLLINWSYYIYFIMRRSYS